MRNGADERSFNLLKIKGEERTARSSPFIWFYLVLSRFIWVYLGLSGFDKTTSQLAAVTARAILESATLSTTDKSKHTVNAIFCNQQVVLTTGLKYGNKADPEFGL